MMSSTLRGYHNPHSHCKPATSPLASKGDVCFVRTPESASYSSTAISSRLTFAVAIDDFLFLAALDAATALLFQQGQVCVIDALTAYLLCKRLSLHWQRVGYWQLHDPFPDQSSPHRLSASADETQRRDLINCQSGASRSGGTLRHCAWSGVLFPGATPWLK